MYSGGILPMEGQRPKIDLLYMHKLKGLQFLSTKFSFISIYFTFSLIYLFYILIIFYT